MKRLFITCASALAMMAATAAHAQTVRFTGNIKGTSTPFSVTYGPTAGFIDSNACYDYSCGYLDATGISRQGTLPEITVGGSKVNIPDLWPVLAQKQVEFGLATGSGWQDSYSDVNDYGYRITPTIARFQAGDPFLEHSYEQFLDGRFEKLEYVEELGYVNIVDSYSFSASVVFGLNVDFFGAYDDPELLNQRRTVQQIGDTLVYDFKGPFFRGVDQFGNEDEWDPKFGLFVSSFAGSWEAPEQIVTPISLFGQITRMEIGALGSIGMPILPTSITPDNGFVFLQSVAANTPIFFDPPVSVGYDYAVGAGDPLITKAMFPTLLGDVDGFDIFALGGGGPALFSNVMGGQWVDFTTIGYLNGISGFSLRDINPALEIDPANPTAFVTGLEFATAGTVNLTQTPVTIEWPIPGGGGGGGGGVDVVPEPASWAMLIAGFGLTGAAMRRRRRVVAA